MGASKRSPAENPNRIKAAQQKLSRDLLKYPAVSGVGIESGEAGNEQIKVYLADDSPKVRSLVPESVNGFTVVVEKVGKIQAS